MKLFHKHNWILKEFLTISDRDCFFKFYYCAKCNRWKVVDKHGESMVDKGLVME